MDEMLAALTTEEQHDLLDALAGEGFNSFEAC